MARTIKTADLNGNAAAELFVSMNPDKVEHLSRGIDGTCSYGILVTGFSPYDLDYPEGWYFAKGSFRNKHNTSNGMYCEIPMLKPDGSLW